MTADATGVLSQQELRRGFQLGEYTLLEPIGHGGQALIWSAWDAPRERTVAIKIISVARGEPWANPVVFEREVEVIANLRHPNILPLYDFGTSRRFHYYTMRYFPSKSLRALLTSGPIPPADALRLAAQISSALAYIHEQGIVHRDLKPDNILLDTQKRVYLADFGLAKRLSPKTELLHTGHGSGHYAPPEQHAGSKAVGRSDIYSFGLVLYEMLTGSLPWDGTAPLAVRQMNAAEQLPDPREINPGLPAGLSEALRKLTAHDPVDRPALAREAYSLVSAALQKDGDATATRQLRVPAMDDSLNQSSPPVDDKKALTEDAQVLLQQARAGWEPDRDQLQLSLTDFTFLDPFCAQAQDHGLVMDSDAYRYMLRGALVHGHHLDFWWHELADPHARLRVCEQTIAHEDEAAVGRSLAQMLGESTGDLPLEKLLPTTLTHLLDLAAEAGDSTLRDNALVLISRSVGVAPQWQRAAAGPDTDSKLVALALSDSPQAKQAALLIGHIRSERAVQMLLGTQPEAAATRVLPALVEIRETAGSLPRSTPTRIRLRVVAELAARQLFGERRALTGTYVASAVGSALGLGFHVYAAYRTPRYLAALRVGDSLEAGLFGLIVGLGIFITRLIVRRLRLLALAPRLTLAAGLGMVVVNLGIISYHRFFLDRPTMGGLVMMGSFVIASGFAAGGGLLRSRGLRALAASTASGLAIGLTWQLAVRTSQSPILYYEIGRPLQTAFLIIVTALLVGSVAHVVELPKEYGIPGEEEGQRK